MRARDIAVIDNQYAAALVGHKPLTLADEVGLADARRRTRLPGNRYSLRCLHCAHESISYDDGPALQRVAGIGQDHGLAVTRNILRGAVIDVCYRAPVSCRRQQRMCIDHARQLDVYSIDRPACRLGRHVQRLGVTSDIEPLGRGLDAHCFEFLGVECAAYVALLHDLGERYLLAIGADVAALDAARGNVHAHQRCPGFAHHCAAGRSRLRQHRERRVHRPRAARDHVTPLRIAIDVLDANIAPTCAELICDYSRERRAHVLPHFGLRDVDEDVALTADLKPHGRREFAACRRSAYLVDRFFAAAPRQHRAETHDQGGTRAAGQESPPAEGPQHFLCSHGHGYAPPPLAATFIAL